MDASAGELPDQPTVDGAEQQLARFGPSLCAWNPVEEPADFGTREIRVDQQPRAFSKQRLQTICLQTLTDVSTDSALPDDRGADGSTRGPLPDDCRLALVGDADGGYFVGAHAGVRQCSPSDGDGGRENLFRIMLDPARLWIVLGDLTVGVAQRGPAGIEDECSRAGCHPAL